MLTRVASARASNLMVSQISSEILHTAGKGALKFMAILTWNAPLSIGFTIDTRVAVLTFAWNMRGSQDD